MPYIRGLVFSSRLLNDGEALHDELQLLHWGGLHLAVLNSEEGDAAAATPNPTPASASANRFGGFDIITILELQPPGRGAAQDDHDDPPGGDDGGMAAAAEAAVCRWAGGLGLQWPGEILVLGTVDARDVAATLCHRHLHPQPPPSPSSSPQPQQDAAKGLRLDRSTEGDVLLPGFKLKSLKEARAATWQQLRRALAHANLRRAEADAEVEAVVSDTWDCGSARDASPRLPPSAAAHELLVVGTAMKPSRERDLAREGLLNLVPRDGLVFAPLDLSLPLEQQMPFHAILHKASDELEYDQYGVPRFGPRIRALADFATCHPEISVVDPLEATAKVINRTELAAVCDSLSSLDPYLDAVTSPKVAGAAESAGQDAATAASATVPAAAVATLVSSGGEQEVERKDGDERAADAAGATSCGKREQVDKVVGANVKDGSTRVRVRVRAPWSTTVSSFSPKEVQAACERLGCPPPYIVKPVVACGTADSHRMALVLRPEGLWGLEGVPLPALVQEFVNHDATIFKVYVAGEKVFHTVRPSIPNVSRDTAQALRLAPGGLLLFDSLKSLPTALQSHEGVATSAVGPSPGERLPSQAVLERLAAHLRTELGLSLFGFDVVIAAAGAGGGVAAGGQEMRGAGVGKAVAREREDVGCGGEEGKSGQQLPGPDAPRPGRDGQLNKEGERARGKENGLRDGMEEQELVVVDVNYFPSYKGANGAPALFRAAVLAAHQQQQKKRCMTSKDYRGRSD